MPTINPTPVQQYLDLNGNVLWAIDNAGREFGSAADTLVAHAGGGQANGLALPSEVNRIITVASAADSVVLPVSTSGMILYVINAAAANAMNLFPAVGEFINALAANTAISVPANKLAICVCCPTGKWQVLIG